MVPIRLRHLLVFIALPAVLAGCSSGSTEVTTAEPTGPTATAPTGPTEAGTTGTTGVVPPTAPTGTTGSTSITGTWNGTWTTDKGGFSGSFTMTFKETGDGFAGTIQIQDSACVSHGEVTAAVDGTTISIGAVQAEQRITFDGEVSGDQMSGRYSSPGECGNDTGTWEATRSG